MSTLALHRNMDLSAARQPCQSGLQPHSLVAPGETGKTNLESHSDTFTRSLIRNKLERIQFKFKIHMQIKNFKILNFGELLLFFFKL